MERQLAQRAGYAWYDVEAETAADFMTYLAATLSRLPELDAVPVTDRLEHLRPLAPPATRSEAHEIEFNGLRQELLRDILPMPAELPPAAAIRRFKDRHSELLVPFRRRVERELIALAALESPELRARRRDLFVEECEDAVVTLGQSMHRVGWFPALGSIGAVVAAIPGVHPLVGLGSAVWSATRGGRHHSPLPDLAYAAYVRQELADVAV